MKPSLVAALVLASIPVAQATSRLAVKASGNPPIVFCEVETTYTGENVRDKDEILWKFKGGSPREHGTSIDCTELSKDFELLIWGAKRSDSGAIIYPEYVPSVIVGASYRILATKREILDRRTGKKLREWMVKDWKTGFTPSGSTSR